MKSVNYITVPEGSVESIFANGQKIWERAHVYGVTWAGGTAATMTYTDDAQGFASPVVGTGSTKGSSPFDNCYPWKDIKMVTDNTNVLVAIPKFWYKWTSSGAQLTLQIADKQVAGFSVSPMHADRGDGKGERDVAYIGKYKCNSSYKSQAGYAPLASKSITAMRTGIKNLGTGYYQQDYASYWTLRMLFLVEFATWDGQSVMQNTSNFTSFSAIITGKTANMAYHTGVSADGYSIQYRYVEDPWENLLEWVDGLYFSGTSVYCINNPNNFAVGSNGTRIGTRPTSEGYIKSFSIPTTAGFGWALFPSATTSSESYVKDGYYYSSTGTVAYIGGTRNSWALHGPFFMYTDFTASSTSTSIAARLMKLP